MVTEQQRRTFDCPPERVLDLVMDIEAYAEVDPKIRPVLWSRRTGDVLEFACRPRLLGMRLPRTVQRMVLSPGERIDIALLPAPANRLARAVADFRASFACRPTGSGTEVVRTLSFDFRPWARPLAEPLFRRWLPGAVRLELDRAGEALRVR